MCRGMTPAISPRYDSSIRFACDCTVSSLQIHTPFPISLIVYAKLRAEASGLTAPIIA